MLTEARCWLRCVFVCDSLDGSKVQGRGGTLEAATGRVWVDERSTASRADRHPADVLAGHRSDLVVASPAPPHHTSELAGHRRSDRRLTSQPSLDALTHFAQSSKMGTVTKGFDARLTNRPFLVLSVTVALNPECQSARKSTTRNVRLAGLASNPWIAICVAMLGNALS